MGFLEVKGLTKHFGGITAVNNVSFQVNRNEIVGLIGPNGAGKSTLVQMLMRALKPDAGHIVFRDEDITSLNNWQAVRRGIAGSFQCTRPFRRLPVIANVMVPCTVTHSSKRKTQASPEKAAIEVMRRVGIAHLAKTPAAKLSQGDLKRLEIARALATGPDLMILDEPFGGLNPPEIEELSRLIKDLRTGSCSTAADHQEGLSIIIIEHKLSELMKIVDRVIVLCFGEILAEGSPTEVTKNEKVIEAYIGKEGI